MRSYLISSIILFVLVVVYFGLDQQVYYYGRNDWDFYHSLPFKVTPKFRYDFEGGFILEDRDEFTLFGQGVRYESFTIEKVEEYGFDKNSITAIVTDSSGRQQVYEFFEDHLSLSGYEVKNVGLRQTNKNYHWVNLNSDKFVENYLMLRRAIRIMMVILIGRIMFIFIKRERA